MVEVALQSTTQAGHRIMTSKITSPQPSIFTSDPLEQVYAREMFGPNNQGGLAAMFLNAASMARERGQGEYLAGVDRSNVMATMLARLEEDTKLRTELAKLGAGLVKEGFHPSSMPIMSELFSNPSGADPIAELRNELIRSQIAENRAKAASSASSGAPQVEYSTVDFPTGVGEARFKGKGRDPAAVAAAVEAVRQKQVQKLREDWARLSAGARAGLENQARQSQPGYRFNE